MHPPLKRPTSNNDIVNHILAVEGWPKFTNDPDDPGGPTKGGITHTTLAKWRGVASCTPEEVEALEIDEAMAIYNEDYIEVPHFDRIGDLMLRMQVIDIGVLHGQGTATKMLQEALGVATDGRWGPATEAVVVAAVSSGNAHNVALRVSAARGRYIGRIVTDNWKKGDKTKAKYDAGWQDRAMAFVDLEATRYRRATDVEKED